MRMRWRRTGRSIGVELERSFPRLGWRQDTPPCTIPSTNKGDPVACRGGPAGRALTGRRGTCPTSLLRGRSRSRETRCGRSAGRRGSRFFGGRRPWEGIDMGRRKIAAELVRARMEEDEDGAVAGVAGDVEVLDEGERDPALRRVRESVGVRQ
jgi:hypothetical protein